LNSKCANGKYVDALAPHFSEIVLVVPAQGVDKQNQYQIKSTNVKITNLPHYHNIPGYWRNSVRCFWSLLKSAKDWDLLNIRIPSHLGFPAYLSARLKHKPIFSVLVGEFYTYNSMSNFPFWKQKIVNSDSRIQDYLTSIIVKHSLTFANGDELFNKFENKKGRLFLTRSSTISKDEILDENIQKSINKPIRILTVATVSSAKGTSLIPDIINHLRESKLDITWLYVGSTEGAAGKKELEKTIAKLKDLNLENQLQFCGAKNSIELKKLYIQSDIFVLPSYIEGIPRVLLEAQSMGLPVITTNVGGIPKAIQNEENGLLVSPGDSYAIAQSVIRLTSDKIFYERLRLNGLKTAREYSLENETKLMLEHVFKIYRAAQ